MKPRRKQSERSRARAGQALLVVMMSVGGTALAAIAAPGCGGGAEPAKSPEEPPPFDDGAGTGQQATPESSAKVQQGTNAIQAGDFEKAKQVLSEAVAEQPNDAHAVYYLGVAQEGAGDVAAAAKSYEQALSLDAKLVEAAVNLSAVRLDGGDAKGALAAAEQGLAAAPDHPALALNRALALSASGDAKGAAAAFAKLHAAKPDDESLTYSYAEALAGAGDAKGATETAKKLLGSSVVETLASAGRLLGKLGAFDECIAGFDKALASKQASELLVQRGICKHGKKDEKGAQADYRAALGLDPKLAAAHFYLGMSLLEQKKKAEAKAALAKAAELDPTGGVGQAAKKKLASL